MSKWEPIRLRRVCRINPPVPEFDALPPESVVTFVPLEAVWPGALDVSRSLPRGQVTDGYTRFLERDVLLPKITPTFEAARAAIASGLANGVGCGTTELHVLRPGPRLDERFLFYAVQTSFFLQQGKGHMFGVAGQKRVPEQFVTDYKLDLPPIEEQRAIVRFLDEQTAKIDMLLKKKKKLLQMLVEVRARVTAEAVTKGVRSPAQLRPTGIDWIGDIPVHWGIRRIKHVARLASGHTPSRSNADYWLNPTTPWFQLTDIWQFRDDSTEYIYETAEMISELGLRNSAAELLPAGTVALSRTASVGFSAILGSDMATTQDFANWVPSPMVEPAYLLYVLRAMRPELERLRFGSTHKTIYMPDIGQLVMPVPPLDEQREIVAHVRKETARLDELRKRVGEVINRLHEYRSALITAAITGQLDLTKAG